MRNPCVIILLAALATISWHALSGFSIRYYPSLILLLFAVQIFLNDLLEGYIARRLKSKYFNLIIAPGTIVHEISHAFTAKITGCRITRISFFDPRGRGGVLGFVEYIQPQDRLQALRSLVIGLAPFFGCGLALLAVLNYPALQGSGISTLKPELVHALDLESMLSSMWNILYGLGNQMIRLDPTNPIILLTLYLEYSFAFGSAPSQKDMDDSFRMLLKHKLQALSLLLFLTTALLMIEYAPSFGEYGQAFNTIALKGLNWAVLVLMISSSMLLIAIPASYILVETAAVRGIRKIIPLTVFLTAYYLTSRYLQAPAEYSLVSSAFLYIAVLYVIRNPGRFMK
ncbi:MAG: hypothetical protein JW724_00205 [Candidatus Altiarchaeota archaeon]|nr:hypothetical protein [Candidatus Altiarchaeota archaeon]